MNRNLLYAIIGVLVIAAAALAYTIYQDQQSTAGIEIGIGNGKMSIERK